GERGEGRGGGWRGVEQAGRQSFLDRRDRAAHFAARLGETVGGSIEPAAHGPAVVAEPADGYAQFSRRLRARPGCKREHEDEGEAASASGSSSCYRLFGLVEGDAEAEQR